MLLDSANIVDKDMDYVESTAQAGACKSPTLVVDVDAWADQDKMRAPRANVTARETFVEFSTPRNDGPKPVRVDAPAAERAFAGLATIAAILFAIVGVFAMLTLFRKQRACEAFLDDPYEMGGR
jgi:hypothetical protein